MSFENEYRYPDSVGELNIAMYVVLGVITCGIGFLVWQYKQMEVLNAWLETDEYNFWMWLLLSIVTCGIYAMYFEYKMAKGINEVQEKNGLKVQNDLATISLLLAIFGLGAVSIAIQQNEINKFYD